MKPDWTLPIQTPRVPISGTTAARRPGVTGSMSERLVDL